MRYRIWRKIEKSFDIISEQRMILENPYIKNIYAFLKNFINKKVDPGLQSIVGVLLHNAFTNRTNFGLFKSVTYVPEDKIWRDQKFVGCADAI
jgi:hypothetical protein